MLIFFDTEFTDLSIDPRLISIGLISEDGREFYAELSDTYFDCECSAFAKEGVLPLLEGGDKAMTLDELTLRLGAWIDDFGQPVKLVTDSISWDWPWIQEIFRITGTWPDNLDGKPGIVAMFDDEVEKAFADGLRRHHALDDAKANRLGWLAWFEANKEALAALEQSKQMHQEWHLSAASWQAIRGQKKVEE